MRLIPAFLLILALFVECSFAKWKIGIFNIMSFDVTSSSLANAIKRSSLLILSRDFQTIDINTNLISRNEVLKESSKSEVDFAIYGFIKKKSDDKYRLVLHLSDIANKRVKTSKEYELRYDPDEIFEVIDTAVEDFRNGVQKVLPKYEESLAIEYRRIIQKRVEDIDIPGRFLFSLNLTSYFSESTFVAHPFISFKYINNSRGGLLGNGWFAGLNIPSLLLSFNDKGIAGRDISKEASVYIGTKVIGPLGVGLDLMLIRLLWDNNPLPFQPRPCIHLNIADFDIITSITLPPRNTEEIHRYLGFSLSVMYQFSQKFGIEIQSSFDDYFTVTWYGGDPREEARKGFSVGIGIFRSFKY